MVDSIFTKIINREIPSQIIYEDSNNIAFLTVMPKQPGHTLVVPKKQIDQLWDLADGDYQSLLTVSKKVAQHLKNVLGVKRVGVMVVGDEVPHAHVHLIPFNTAHEFNRPAQAASPEELAEMAKKLAF